MKTISVTIPNPYEVVVGEHLITDLGQYALQVVKPRKAVLICDTNVWQLYGTEAACSLARSGFNIIDYILPEGEQSKSGDTCLKLLRYLSDNHIEKSDIIIALGGGVIMDIVGFVSATYLCGVPYIQVPTTLLAMVDDTIGCRHTLHLPSGKNQFGVSYAPSLVICDTTTLKSLSLTDFHNGCAEVIMLSVMLDCNLFNHIMDHAGSFDREYVISRCIELKRDRLYTGKSVYPLLRLGEPICNAIKTTEGYAISHGNALSLGIATVSRAAQKMKLCDKTVSDAILKILADFSLPIGSSHTADDVFDAAIPGVACADGTINLIVPHTIGNCSTYNTDASGLRIFIEAGL